MMKHALFVGQYDRVAIAIPLTFCHQSDEVIQKRKFRMRVVLFAEVAMAAFLALQFCIQFWSDYGFYVSWICWTIPANLLAIALGLAFKRLHTLQA